MEDKWFQNNLFRLFLLSGAVFYFLKFITPLISPLLISALFVAIFGPFLQRMQKKCKIKRQPGAIMLLVLAGILIGLLLWALFTWIMGSLPEWIEGLDSLENSLYAMVQTICEFCSKAFHMDTGYLKELLTTGLKETIDQLQLSLVPNMLANSSAYLKVFVSIGGFLICFVITSVFLAKDYDEIMNKLLNRQECHVFLEIFCGVIRYLASFVKAQIIIIAIIGGLSAAVLGFAGIRHGVFWGILAGILDALPFIGTGIVLLPLGINQFLNGSYGRAACCLILYITCIFIREFLEPKLIGNRMGVPPVAILLSIYAGVKLFGVWGILKGPLGFIIIREAYRSINKRGIH